MFRLAIVVAALSLAACAAPSFSGSPLGVPPAASGAAAAGSARGAAVTPLKGTIALNIPIGLAEDKHDNLYVANAGTSQILVYNSDYKQIASKTIGQGIKNPSDVAFDKSGNLYVTDRDTLEVTVYDPSGKQIKSKTLHTYKSTGFSPSGVALDSSGNVWVSNRNDGDFSVGEIQVFNSSGKQIGNSKQNLEYPVGITFRGKDAWICDSTTVADSLTVFDASVKEIKTVSTPGFTPTYAAQDSKGNLYVTNGLAADIAILDSSGNVIKTTNNKGLNLPYGIAFNHTGNFYVANVGNNTITEYSSSGKLLHTIK